MGMGPSSHNVFMYANTLFCAVFQTSVPASPNRRYTRRISRQDPEELFIKYGRYTDTHYAYTCSVRCCSMRPNISYYIQHCTATTEAKLKPDFEPTNYMLITRPHERGIVSIVRILEKINSLWASAVIWWQQSWSTLVQIIAWCLKSYTAKILLSDVDFNKGVS